MEKNVINKKVNKVVESPHVINPPHEKLTLKELTELLVKNFNKHEGIYSLSLEIQISVGNFGPAESVAPGAMFGVSGVGLNKVDKESVNTVDASKVNPLKASKKSTAVL